MTPNAEQLANLATLRDFLPIVDQDNFHMGWFAADGNGCIELHELKEVKHTCGTAGCAIGWAPAAGIKPLKGEGWVEYSERVFGYACNSTTWEYMFSSDWSDVDNSTTGAAERIGFVLKNGGHPEGWSETDLTDE